MKLPRWLVIAMLTSSVLAVLAAAGWWWVTWPERTARDFVHVIALARFDDRNRILSPELQHRFDMDWYNVSPWPQESIDSYIEQYPEISSQLIRDQNEMRSAWREDNLAQRPRTFLDLTVARQTFTISGYWFAVARGKVARFGFVDAGEDVDLMNVSF